MDNEQIEKIVSNYVKRKEYYKERYHNKIKNDPVQVEKQRIRSREWALNNKDKKQEYYQKNKDVILSFNRYKYAVKKGKEELWIENNEEEYDKLVSLGKINQNTE